MDLRKDPITRSWVLAGAGETFDVPPSPCPYCPGNEAAAGTPLYAVPPADECGPIRVFPHPHPLYRSEGEANRRADGIYDTMVALGSHELIVESLDHDQRLSAAPEADISRLLHCWASRIAERKADPRFKYVTVFRNSGGAAGQQIKHANSELTATLFIPRRILYELRSAREYYEVKERCVLCDIIRQEERQGLRVVELSERFVVLCPYASRVPYELWILPRYHSSSFEEDLPRHSDALELAGMLRRALARLRHVAQSYHLVLHTVPNTGARPEIPGYWTTVEDDYHWHIEILPITETRSKSYSIKEVYYCSLLPEEAAARLKELPVIHSAPAQAGLEFQNS